MGMGKAGQAKQVFKSFGNKGKRIGTKDKATKAKTTTPKLKKKAEPGSVLILLAGRFRGRRVVFLKQLEGGAMLVTGPYAVNGVPLRRVNQRFCIATSTKVDLKGANFSKVTDKYFAREAKKGEKKFKKGEEAMFAGSTEKTGVSAEKKAGQKKMDEALLKNLTPDF